MLREDIEACKEIARHVVREEIAKAHADLQKPVVETPAASEPKVEELLVRSHHKKP